MMQDTRSHSAKGRNSRTDRDPCTFVVKEFMNGEPWIVVEQRNNRIPILQEGFVGFDLPMGTTLEKAYEIANYLNANMTHIAVTLFDKHRCFHDEAIDKS